MIELLFCLISLIKNNFQITNQEGSGDDSMITFVLIIVGIATMLVLLMVVTTMHNKGGVKLSI